jgi:hypothetical protein
VAARVCPQCMKTVPPALAMAFSDALECPHCQVRLEVSSPSRMPAVFIALIVAALAYHLTSNGDNLLTPVLAEFCAILAYGVVSATIIAFMADLQFAPVVVVVTEVAAAHGHGGDHH